MPGWIRPVDQSAVEGNAKPATSAAADAHAAEPVPLVSPLGAMGAGGNKKALAQSQRDELLAEILGDVVAVSERLDLIARQIGALESALTANDLVRWRNTIDMKMSELADVNLSKQAAQRLEAFAQAYMTQLAKEANTLVVLQAKKAVADTMIFNQLFERLNREWILRLASVAAVAFAASLMATLVGRFL